MKVENLNLLFTGRKGPIQTKTSLILFDNIEPFILEKLKECSELVGCVAWISSANLLREMNRIKNVDLIVTSDKFSKINKKRFKRLKSVRVLGLARGRRRPLMHHKFLIGLKKGKPSFLINGSYNYSEHSKQNLENIMYFTDLHIIEAYLSEFKKLRKKSRAIRFPR